MLWPTDTTMTDSTPSVSSKIPLPPGASPGYRTLLQKSRIPSPARERGAVRTQSAARPAESILNTPVLEPPECYGTSMDPAPPHALANGKGPAFRLDFSKLNIKSEPDAAPSSPREHRGGSEEDSRRGSATMGTAASPARHRAAARAPAVSTSVVKAGVACSTGSPVKASTPPTRASSTTMGSPAKAVTPPTRTSLNAGSPAAASTSASKNKTAPYTGSPAKTSTPPTRMSVHASSPGKPATPTSASAYSAGSPAKSSTTPARASRLLESHSKAPTPPSRSSVTMNSPSKAPMPSPKVSATASSPAKATNPAIRASAPMTSFAHGPIPPLKPAARAARPTPTVKHTSSTAAPGSSAMGGKTPVAGRPTTGTATATSSSATSTHHTAAVRASYTSDTPSRVGRPKQLSASVSGSASSAAKQQRQQQHEASAVAAAAIAAAATTPNRATSVGKTRSSMQSETRASLLRSSAVKEKAAQLRDSQQKGLHKPTTIGTTDVQRSQVHSSPARRSSSSISDSTAVARQASSAISKSATKSSILSAIPEKIKALHGRATPGARPMGLSLNLSAVKPSYEDAEHDAGRPSAAAAPALPASVPKLNLAPLLQQKEEEQSGDQVYTVAPDEELEQEVDAEVLNSKKSVASIHSKKSDKGSRKSATPESQDHYYFYPKMDSKIERKTLDVIKKLPRGVADQMKKIYDDMVQAKQNCEAIAFRGHRLLDQLQGTMKERIDEAAEREAMLQSQMTAYQQQALEAQMELDRVKSVLYQEQQDLQQRRQQIAFSAMGASISRSGSMEPRNQLPTEEDSMASWRSAMMQGLRNSLAMSAQLPTDSLDMHSLALEAPTDDLHDGYDAMGMYRTTASNPGVLQQVGGGMPLLNSHAIRLSMDNTDRPGRTHDTADKASHNTDAVDKLVHHRQARYMRHSNDVQLQHDVQQH